MALLLPVLPADAAPDQRLADASTAELAAAKARYERAFSEYTRLSTTGGAGLRWLGSPAAGSVTLNLQRSPGGLPGLLAFN